MAEIVFTPPATPSPEAPAATTDTPAVVEQSAAPSTETSAAAPQPTDSELVAQMAKLSAESRAAAKEVEALRAKLAEADALREQVALLDEIKKSPRKLLDMGLTWEQVLESMTGDPEPKADPRLEALLAEQKKLQDRLDAREKAEAEAKAEEERQHGTRVYESALQNVQKLVADKGAAPDADGLPRWAVAGSDPGLVRQALDAVINHVETNKLTITQAEGLALCEQAMDQLEQHERGRVKGLVAALKAGVPKPAAPAVAERVSREKPAIVDRFSAPPPPPAMGKQPAKGPVTKPSRFQ